MSDLPPLVADGGELRLARRVASYVYGRREVTWPDDFDDPEEDLPDGREFGWVARLPGREPGLSERRFVRGDVQIDAVEQTSNVEQVMDESGARAGGDVFFESLIEGAGIGRLVPGRDFDEGDLVDVRFWGRILPDQLVTAIEWHDGVPSVKIGGQLVSDAGELARSRAETIRLINRERKERLEDVDGVNRAASRAQSTAVDARSRADGAQSTADTARGEIERVRGVLGGVGASQDDLVAQLADANAQIESQGGEPQPGLIPAYLDTNTRLWQFQQQWNREREEIDARQDAQARELEQSQIALQYAQRDIARRQVSFLAFNGDPVENQYGRAYVRSGDLYFEKAAGWTGEIAVIANANAINNFSHAESERFTSEDEASWRVKVGLFESIRTAVFFISPD